MYRALPPRRARRRRAGDRPVAVRVAVLAARAAAGRVRGARAPAAPRRQPLAQRRPARLLPHRRTASGSRSADRRRRWPSASCAATGSSTCSRIRASPPTARASTTRASWTTKLRAPIASRARWPRTSPIIEANHLTAVPVQTIADIEAHPHWQARGLTARRAQRRRRRPHAQRRAAPVGDARRDPLGRRRARAGQPRRSTARSASPATNSSACARAASSEPVRDERAHAYDCRASGCSIGGEWQAGHRRRRSTSSTSSPARSIGTVECAGRDQVDAAVAAARASFARSRRSTRSSATCCLQKTARARRAARRRARRADHRRRRPADHRRDRRSRARGPDAHRLGGRRQAAGRRDGADRGGARAGAPHGLHDPRAARRRLRHHRVQLAAEHDVPQGRAGARARATPSS